VREAVCNVRVSAEEQATEGVPWRPRRSIQLPTAN